MKHTTLLISIFLILFFSGSASAATFLVSSSSSDDSVAIQTQIDGAAANGGLDTVYMQSGTYYLKRQVSTSQNDLILTGASDVVITIIDDTPIITGTVTDGFDEAEAFFRFTGDRITVHGLEVDGNQCTDETNQGIANAEYLNQIKIRGADYYNFFKFSGCDDITIYDMDIHNGGGDMIYLYHCDGAEIYNNNIWSPGHECIRLYESNDLHVHNNIMAFWVNSCIRNENVANSIFEYNTITGYGQGTSGHAAIYKQGYRSLAYGYPMYNNVFRYNTISHTPHSAFYFSATWTSASAVNSPLCAGNQFVYNNIAYDTCRGSTTLGVNGGFATLSGVNNSQFYNNVGYEFNAATSAIRFAWLPVTTGPSTYADEWTNYYIFRNNIFQSNHGDYVIEVDSSIDSDAPHSISWDYNNHYGTTGSNYNSGTYVTWGTHNYNEDPSFYSAAGNDFHLKSVLGRWNEATENWEYDATNSTSIDRGDPSYDYSNEGDYPSGYINVGAYGNTPKASLGDGIPPNTTGSAPGYVGHINIKSVDRVVIDGSLADWSGEYLYLTGDSDNNASVMMRYNDTYLFLACNVTDETLTGTHFTNDSGQYLDDSIEVYIDTQNDGGTMMQTDDYHFIISILDSITDDIGTGSGKNYTYDMDILRSIVTTGTINNTGDTDTGYIIEAAVPWSDLGGKPSGDTVGLLVAVNDYDTTSTKYYLNYGEIEQANYVVPSAWLAATIINPSSSGSTDDNSTSLIPPSNIIITVVVTTYVIRSLFYKKFRDRMSK